jgi:hypothetical protein
LAQATALKKAAIPTSRALKFLRDWLERPAMGNDFLSDREKTIWNLPNTPDLITLLPSEQKKDAFTSLLNGILLDIYHRVYGHKKEVYIPQNLATYYTRI